MAYPATILTIALLHHSHLLFQPPILVLNRCHITKSTWQSPIGPRADKVHVEPWGDGGVMGWEEYWGWWGFLAEGGWGNGFGGGACLVLCGGGWEAGSAYNRIPATVEKRTGIDLLSKVALTEESQYEEVSKKSLRDFHKTHLSGSGTVTKIAPSAAKIKPFVTNEGTGAKPGVPDITPPF
ncbi:hypothetical protein Tco_1341981 [Tanacetum coccineum]